MPAWLTMRLIGYGIAALAAAGLLWRINHWRTDAQKLPAAVKALAGEREARAADRKAFDADRIASEADRARFAADLDAIRARYANMPPVAPARLVTAKETPIAPNQTTCPDPRVSSDFRLRWNAASTP